MTQPSADDPAFDPVSTDLCDLVGHNHCVAGNTAIASVQKLFQAHRFNFMAVVDNKRVVGMCSRDRVGGMLGSQFGFSIYGKKSIRDYMVPHPEIIRDDTPAPKVLERVFGRSPERFYEDVILVDATGSLLGLIPVDSLVRLQNSMLREKIRLFERSEQQLIQQKKKLVTVTDELECANAELETARDLAVEGARLKSEFLANMSHEIRTPMNGIVGMISLLQESELDEEQKGFADTVQRSADSLLGIINDILDYSKIEAGKLAVQADDTPIRELVEECVQLLAGNASSKGLELILDIDPGVPEWMRLDPLRYRQILNNLIGNAIKFTQAGEVLVVVDIAHDPRKGAYMRTLVRDTGIGVAEEEQQHLFNAFMQADGSTSRKYGGTGLGLAISRRLATLMDGELEFTSELGQGSVFWLDLPLLRSDPEEFPAERNRINPDMRAIVIDDHPRVREVMGHLLMSEHCAVELSEDAEAGMIRIREAAHSGVPFDFAFVEAENEALSGYFLAEELRRDPAMNELRIVLMGDVSKRERSCGEGVYRLFKPICPGQLRRLLERYQPDAPAHKRSPTEDEAMALQKRAQCPAMRILVVEDSPTNQRVAVRMLERLGHEAFLSENGLEALEFLRCETVDCILMDCQMPEMDGYACTRAIREGYHGIACRDIPIIATTAHAMKGDRKKCLDSGMNDYLPKPIKMEDLADALLRAYGMVSTG